jgi:hypothetical protein
MSQTNLPPQNDLPITLAEVLSAELVNQLPSEAQPINQQVQSVLARAQSWDEKLAASKKIVPDIYQVIHKLSKKRSALCLSGGGVRSATFNLGVLQGLARCGLLDKFDYLSTVSGGGFIGSWLTAWIHRADGDVKRVVGPLSDPPTNPLDPEPKPIYNLRVYANYLTPKKGLLSPDTWTLIAVYLRNLFLNWLVFLPAIMTFLMLPRLWANIVNYAVRMAPNHGPYWPLLLGMFGLVFGVISLVCITLNLPSVLDKNWRTSVTLWTCAVPLVLMAVCFSLYWVLVRDDIQPVSGWLSSLSAVFHGKRPSWHVFFIAGAIIPALPQLAVTFKAQTPIIQKIRLVMLVGAGGAVTGVLTYALLNLSPGLLVRLSNAVRFGTVVPNSDLLYVSLSVPFLLCMFMIGGTFVAGFSSRFSGSEDQEWWARSGAWLLITVMVCGAFSLIVMFGPLLLIDLRGLFGGGNLGSIKAKVTSIVGIVSGVISLFGGFSSKTKGNGKEENADTKTKMFSMATSVAAAVFALYIAVVLVWMTDWALLGLAKALQPVRQLVGWFVSTQSLQAAGQVTHVHASSLPANFTDHQMFVTQSPWWFDFFATGVFALATLALGWCINTNRFSLHYYWRNRMMRSYLGATRDEKERDKTKSWFTDFDREDNVSMHALKQARPFHVVNVTLNLVGGDKLEWQDRKAESFTMSPLHCGSYWLGYRKSADYGGKDGMSLATAVAISGAAASPNMGYMMTSAVLRIIMTLFNVRLGFWLGNPGPYGKDTYKLDSPIESVRPIVEEALGMTDDKSSYVYLSDGGHFENFGLYEMILRRCRFIVVGDGSTDTKYSYDSLAIAIRQIRVDFGVPIEMGTMRFGNDPDVANNYCAVGVVRYSCVDKPGGCPNTDFDPAYDGVLVYIKPSLIGDEPRDVLNYHATSTDFPQETIADQWFSEPQFESYRALGSQMVRTICHSTSEGKGTLGKVEAGVKALIESLSTSEPAFGNFATGALNHVRRHGDPAPKDS